ncbi:MAG: complex I NDUFA9 subunit family protein [Anaerolineae bacterium]
MILITGATGLIGRHMVGALTERGYAVRCLLPEYKQRRLPWDTEADNAPEIITGDLLDEEALFQAVTGVHVIFHLENAQWWGRQRDLERVEIVGTRNLIAAARAARVGRIITLSHLGATPSSGFTLLRIKGMLEEVIRGSGLAYTIIRAGLVYAPDDAFISHIAMMLRMNPIFFLMPGQGEVVLHPLFIDDLVEVLVRSLETIAVVDETVEIGGAEYITLTDLLATVMRVTGMRRLIIPAPPYFIRWITTLYGTVFRRTLMTQQWMDLLAANRTARLGNTYTYFGVQPRRFEDTLMSYLPRQHFFFRGLRYMLRRRPRGL